MKDVLRQAEMAFWNLLLSSPSCVEEVLVPLGTSSWVIVAPVGRSRVCPSAVAAVSISVARVVRRSTKIKVKCRLEGGMVGSEVSWCDGSEPVL